MPYTIADPTPEQLAPPPKYRIADAPVGQKPTQPEAQPPSMLTRLWQGLTGTIGEQPTSVAQGVGQALRATPAVGPLQGVWEGLLGAPPPKTTDLASKIQAVPEKLGYLGGSMVRGTGELIGRVMNPAMWERMMAGQATPEERVDMLNAAALGAGSDIPKPGMAAAPHEITPARQRLQDFQATGIEPTMPAIGQGRAAGLTAQATRVLPFSPVGAGMKRMAGQTAEAAERTASRYGTAADEFSAGSTVRNALRRFAEDRSQATKDYGEFDRLMHGAAPSPLTNTNQFLNKIQGRFPSAPDLTGTFTNPTLRTLSERLRGKTLTMPELKELRTQIGYKLENPSFGPEDIPRAQLRQLYASLTQDMQLAARTQSPEAVRALTKATTNYGMRMRQLDRLEPLIKPDAPERVFSRIESAARGGDVGLLGSVKKAVTPEEWSNVGASMIRNFGNPSAGAVKVAGTPDFSIDAFATNWNKLSGRSKDLIFGTDETGSSRAGLEQLARVVNAQKAIGKLANTSHTYELAAAAGMVTDIMGSLAMGRIPIPELAAYAGSYGVSKLMMSPAFTRWLYKIPQYSSQEEALEALRRAVTGAAGTTVSRQQRSNATAEPQPAP